MSLADTYPRLRIVDLATNFAGPYAAMILADMGADVIKVERAPRGDDTRELPPFVEGSSTVFAAVNRNKRSIMLDFKDDADRDVLLRLIATADVVIESFPPGIAEKLRLDWKHLSAINPALLLASVSAFGDGPLGKTMPGYDALVQAVSGMMSFTGNPGERTIRLAPSILDLTTGIWTATGIMAALARRSARDGVGEHLTSALIDTAFNMMNHQVLGFIAAGIEPEKLGSGAPSAAPYGVYEARDGEVLIATATNEQFGRLCVSLGIGEARNDPRFQDTQSRIAHRKEINEIISGVAQKMTVAELLAALGSARIPAGQVNSLPQALSLPVTRERRLIVGGSSEAIPQIRLPIGGATNTRFRRAPDLDEHHAEILSELACFKPKSSSRT